MRDKKSQFGRGFTLVEMLVVIAIVVLVLGMALPSITGIFTAGADSQAYNLIASQLSAARALAIQEGTYAGVHVQMGNEATDSDLKDTCWAAVMQYDTSLSPAAFRLADGFTPRQIPGRYAFGEVSGAFITASAFDNLSDTNLDNFTSFTVVFSPNGAVVKQVNNANIQFDIASIDSLFLNSLWVNHGNLVEAGATALTLFSYKEFREFDSITSDTARETARQDYLDTNADLIPLNVYTGQLFER